MNTVKNFVQLVGNLGRKPEVRHLESGKSVAKFSLATSDYFISKTGEKVQDTQWHNVIAWSKNAHFAEKELDKGVEVAIKGRIVYKMYDDKNGIRRTITEIVAEEIELVPKHSIAATQETTTA